MRKRLPNSKTIKISLLLCAFFLLVCPVLKPEASGQGFSAPAPSTHAPGTQSTQNTQAAKQKTTQKKEKTTQAATRKKQQTTTAQKKETPPAASSATTAATAPAATTATTEAAQTPTAAPLPESYPVTIMPHSVINFSKEDDFSANIRKDTGEAQTISLNIYKQSVGEGSLTLSPGHYSVEDINYSGKNNRILAAGFAIPKTFDVSSSGTILDLYVGQLSGLTGENFLIKKNGQTVDRAASAGEGPSDGTDTPSTEDTSAEEGTNVQSSDPDPSKVIEKVKQNNKNTNKKKKSLARRLAPMIRILVIAGLIFVFGLGFWKRRH